MKLVLDAWALLAFLQREEPAASRVRECFLGAEKREHELFVSIINLGEVYYRIGKIRSEEEARSTLEELKELPLTILPADSEAVFRAARLKITHAISYADAFAAAAAQALGATLLTGDPELIRLRGLVSLEQLERRQRADTTPS